MNYYNKIELLKKERKVSKKKLCEIIDISPQGYAKMIINDTIQVKMLQKIADYFGLPITYFFDGVDSTEANIDKVFETLKEIVKSKMK